MKKLSFFTLSILLLISNSANAHGEDAVGFILLQLISFIFVIALTVFIVKDWKYKLIVIFAALPMGLFLDLIPNNFAVQLIGTNKFFAVFFVVMPSLVLTLAHIAKLYLPSEDFGVSINRNSDSKTKSLKTIYTTLQLLVLFPVLIAAVISIILIADSIYVKNTSSAFNKIELNISENAVVTLIGRPSNAVNCTYNISAKNSAYVLPGNDSANFRECIVEVHYESFFHGWAIGYTTGRKVISKYEYLLEKPNFSFKWDWLKPSP